jgi:hypothetical protein
MDDGLRNAVVSAAHDALGARGLPDDIIFAILGSLACAADAIRRAAITMATERRNIRMSIRWFRMSCGLPDPVFLCNHGWHWVDMTVMRMPIDYELSIREMWVSLGRPVPPYVHVPVSASMVQASRKRHRHYVELHALRRKTRRARRVLPRWWAGV